MPGGFRVARYATRVQSSGALDPASIIALVALGSSGVMALWKIANGLGRFESRTTTILEGVQTMLRDHEDRLRTIERRP